MTLDVTLSLVIPDNQAQQSHRVPVKSKQLVVRLSGSTVLWQDALSVTAVHEPHLNPITLSLSGPRIHLIVLQFITVLIHHLVLKYTM